MAGFLMAQAGRVLKPGETLEHDGAIFKVERVDGFRIRRIRFTPTSKKEQEPQESAAALLPFIGASVMTALG